ncbi:hypothetical protein JXB31_02825 [Candidatus Woesearchaeota archaeon]|nr:hypothetical protein [Candidatus Woesearchaeota archaeon]
MDEIKLLEELFDKKIIGILKQMLKDPARQFYLQELSECSGVPMATCSRILSRLNSLEIIEIRKISRFKLYSLYENKKVEFLAGLFKEEIKFLELFVERIKDLRGLRNIILHGKEQKNRANVLLIGENMDPGEIKAACAEIKEKYGFLISSLSLNHEQYEQMSQMGLYPGPKKVLYER